MAQIAQIDTWRSNPMPARPSRPSIADASIESNTLVNITMRYSGITLLLLSLCALLGSSHSQSMWAGANSYYLHALRAPDRTQVLDAMQAAGMNVVRIFISSVYANNKGSNSVRMPDVEEAAVGQWDDTILRAVDTLMTEVSQRQMKLIIALHDRYSLGCWASDAYVRKYNIPVSLNCGTNPQSNDIVPFYRNAEAAADMDRRFAHILDHRNPNFGNRRWSEIPEAILGFDIQNEAQAHAAGGVIANRNWVCDRASRIRPRLSTGILVMTGGGADIWDSALDEHFACQSINVVSLHTYGGASAISNLGQLIQKARSSGKRLVLEEFGALGSGKATSLTQQVQASQNLGLPWMVWQVVKPNNFQDYETFIEDGASWTALSNGGRATRTLAGAFNWPELGSGPIPTPSPRASPSPARSPSPFQGPCDKCNVPVCLGGCKCDSTCACRPGLGGSKCDKCNIAQSEGGCKCNNNCDCLAGSCWA